MRLSHVSARLAAVNLSSSQTSSSFRFNCSIRPGSVRKIMSMRLLSADNSDTCCCDFSRSWGRLLGRRRSELWREFAIGAADADDDHAV